MSFREYKETIEENDLGKPVNRLFCVCLAGAGEIFILNVNRIGYLVYISNVLNPLLLLLDPDMTLR